MDNLNVEELKQKVTRLEHELAENTMRYYKERFFKSFFGNRNDKKWALSLFNALNGTNASNPDNFHIDIFDGSVQIWNKNDAVLFFSFEINLWESLASFNPNIPLKFFMYGSHFYEYYSLCTDCYLGSSKLQPIPRPRCFCFYNGTEDQPESQILTSSDFSDVESGIEAKVTMINVNNSKNKELMDACAPLKEFGWFVDAIRRHLSEKMNLNTALDIVLAEMPNGYEIKPFILETRTNLGFLSSTVT